MTKRKMVVAVILVALIVSAAWFTIEFQGQAPLSATTANEVHQVDLVLHRDAIDHLKASARRDKAAIRAIRRRSRFCCGWQRPKFMDYHDRVDAATRCKVVIESRHWARILAACADQLIKCEDVTP